MNSFLKQRYNDIKKYRAESIAMQDNIESISTSICTGCGLCANLCPTDAIALEEGSEGLRMPQIDLKKCIYCGVCLDRCVVNPKRRNPPEPHFMGEGYAAWVKNQNIRINSTSGGIYYALASSLLDAGDYICGCAFTDDYKRAGHIIGNTRNTLLRTMRSKYIQSDIGLAYRKIREVLESGKKVLFVGAPCQVDALRSYVRDQYENLVTCDFVCRGVNSPKAYQNFLRTIEKKYGSKVKAVHFKNKRFGWTSLSTHVIFENGKSYYGDRFIDPWINGYITGHFFMRECCYNCKYADTERYGDITIGDFWGSDSIASEELFAGVSCVSVNTDKGRKLLEQASDRLEVFPVTISEIVDGNGCLNRSTLKIPAERSAFFARCEREDFDKLVYELLGWDYLRKCKNKAKSLITTIRNRRLNRKSGEYINRILDDMEELNDGETV